MGYVPLLFLGIIISIMGVINLRGNLSTIHWYNRWKVSEADAPKYGKAMGLGTLIIGVSIALTAALQMLLDSEIVYGITIAGTIIGAAVILYAQLKYNKGII